MASMNKRQMVIFDFDGVIADSWWLTHKTARKIYPGLTETMHRRGFEGNILKVEKDWAHLERKDVDFYDEYEKETHLVKFFEIAETISHLAEKYMLSIVSSTPNKLIKYFLLREGLAQCFSDLLGADIHESKHEKIKMLFEKYILLSAECVMITDTSGDVREAHMAGVDSIGVSWGFHEIERLQKVDTFRIVHTPRELVGAVNDYFSK